MDALTQSNWIVFGSLGAALLFVGGAYARLRWMDHIAVKLSDGMGLPKWDFSQSWATTLTAAGGVLTILLSAEVLPDIKVPGGLGVFFGILVLVAPFLFSAFSLRPVSDGTDAEPSRSTAYQGYVGIYLIACLLTLWGVCGELATTMALFSDLASQAVLSTAVDIILLVCLIVTVLGVAMYAWRTIPATIKAQRDEHEQKVAARTTATKQPGLSADMKAKLASAPPPALSSWALL